MKFLCIFAHPDDEAYGPAGTIARLIAEGATGYLLTLTQGGAGTLGICKELPVEKKKKMRSRELACAAKTLGFKEHFLLDYPDGGLRQIPEEEGIATITEFLETVRPEVIITFHYGGISGHPDHITTSHWSIKAAQRWKNPNDVYYYGMAPDTVAHFKNRRLIPIPEEEIHLRINVEAYVSKKVAAIHCHQSQLELWQQLQQTDLDYLDLIQEEVFSLAHSGFSAPLLQQWIMEGRRHV